MRGKCLHQRGADGCAGRESRKAWRVGPGGGDGRGEQAIACIGERRVLVPRKAGKRRIGRLEQDETAKAGGDRQAGGTESDECSPFFISPPDEGARMRPACNRKPFPWMLDR